MQEEFSEKYIPTSNWMKFTSIGDNIKGTYTGSFHKAGQGDLPSQEVYELINCEINGATMVDTKHLVPIKSTNSYILNKLKNIRLGQRIGFKFEKEIPAIDKIKSPAKSIQVYLWGMDETYNPNDKESFDDMADKIVF